MFDSIPRTIVRVNRSEETIYCLNQAFLSAVKDMDKIAASSILSIIGYIKRKTEFDYAI